MEKEPAFFEEIKAGVNLLQVASRLRDDLEAALQTEVAMSHAEYDVMMQLLQHGSSLPLSELAELSLFSQSGITRLLDRLERKGLASRQLSSEDRRLVYATLTKEGSRKLQVAMPLVRQIIKDRFSRHVQRTDIAELRRILLDIIRGNGWLDERQVTHQPSGQSK